MSEQHKATPSSGWNATPEQWADCEIGACLWKPTFKNIAACLLELRARVEALEATQRPRVFTAAEVAPIVTPITRDRDETGDYIIVHDTPAPAGSLVERVGERIDFGINANQDAEGIALAVLRDIAAWLRDLPGWEGSTLDAIGALLDQEATR